MLKDRLFGATMAIGGVTVIVAIVTIFFFLLWVVVPLFRGATLAPRSTVEFPVTDVVHLALNEYADIGFALSAQGRYRFFQTSDGTKLGAGDLLPAGARLTLLNAPNHGSQTLTLALDSGEAVLARAAYHVSFTENRRITQPEVIFPFGATPIRAAPSELPITVITAEANDSTATIAALTDRHTLYLTHLAKVESLLGDESSLEQTQVEISVAASDIAYALMDIDQNELYLLSKKGHISFYDIRDKTAPKIVEELRVVPAGTTITAASFLSSGISLLIGDSKGRITQWFPVRDNENNYRLTRVRTFSSLAGPITQLAPEYSRKGFIALDAKGNLGIFHATAKRTLLVKPTLVAGPRGLAIAPRADALAILDNEQRLHTFEVSNKHPEVSWRALWGKVWYEGRAQPEYLWQSSSASSDFEPKFSLTPLAFGTIKAAFYAMLFAIPIAIFGAIYTAYFMQSRLRMIVKPSIEIMAALPTVILGFLAGLWLAPLIETHLIGVLGATFLFPFVIFFSAWCWSRLPDTFQQRLPDGTETLLLIPVICATLWIAMTVSQPLEQWWFDGNLPLWLAQELGITYDQRNSLVVGIAMGFAVIPNIYSISEDAVFGVPRQLTTGSLALGATPWQTVTRVVLLTASPGIFSAVMIGLGRAVGETMIVLMSTGNTPIMDLNIFQGFRALSANIAVEMPESEVNSTHYRILFLAALVLFAVTFVFNTIAEVVRQRLRTKYGNL
ncbi:MAG: ABC transporter permease subunit [Gammaproteobacteria bacterium]|nr:ABC transporter permease subunit [Gammaproteobacteria bacterium]